MQYTQLGRTGLLVSRFCLGTMNFGVDTEESDAFAIMDRALELGVNFFDTADVYGKPLGRGRTEEIVGRWLAQGGGRREKIVLATKLYGPMGDLPHQRGMSALHIRRACDASLRRLGTDTIDLYQMHHVDRGLPGPTQKALFGLSYMDQIRTPTHHTRWEEIWQAMDQLVAAGKVVYVGSSNFAAWNIAQANTIAAARNSLGLVSEQSKYSLATRAIELEVIPACRELGLGLIPYSPIGGGLLAGAPEKAKGGRRGKLGPNLVDPYRASLEKYEAFCREMGRKPADVALAWLLANSVVTAPIIGPRIVSHLDDSMAALDIELSREELERLDQIWPGTDSLWPGVGSQAPEAYAW